jgi:hypothetical protein
MQPVDSLPQRMALTCLSQADTTPLPATMRLDYRRNDVRWANIMEDVRRVLVFATMAGQSCASHRR